MRTTNNRHAFNPCGLLQATTQIGRFALNTALFVGAIYYLLAKHTGSIILPAIALSLGPLPNMLFSCRSSNSLRSLTHVAFFNSAVATFGAIAAILNTTSSLSQDDHEPSLSSDTLTGLLLGASSIINLFLLLPTFVASRFRRSIDDHRDSQTTASPALTSPQ